MARSGVWGIGLSEINRIWGLGLGSGWCSSAEAFLGIPSGDMLKRLEYDRMTSGGIVNLQLYPGLSDSQLRSPSAPFAESSPIKAGRWGGKSSFPENGEILPQKAGAHKTETCL